MFWNFEFFSWLLATLQMPAIGTWFENVFARKGTHFNYFCYQWIISSSLVAYAELFISCIGFGNPSSEAYVGRNTFNAIVAIL